jgi:signal transduction histidine kinase
MVEVILTRKDQLVVIEIRDHGIGIPANKLPIIFDPFSKAGRTGLKGEQSTGLGLSIVKQIVEKHNGTIEVESEEGKGSTFRIILPVSE